jgi:predicted DNA binding CopG/RHH family protein
MAPHTKGQTDILVRLPTELHQAVKEAAKTEGVPVSQIARELLASYARQAGTYGPPREATRERVSA